ncbi:MAG: DUF4268 domain-containing protein [Terriglobia bacterium]
MIYMYDKRKKSLTLLKETEFHSHKLFERQDLSKWVEQYPAILGEELLIVTTEYDRFDKTNERLDLLAVDKQGNLVVIELKRDDSGKSVDLQATKYAAYCSTLRLGDLVEMYTRYQKQKGAELSKEAAQHVLLKFIDNDDFEELNDRPRIILVAKEFRPEVTASVLWLRKFGIDISCVKWDPYELSEDCVVFNSSVLIPLPEAKDFIIQSEKKETAQQTETLTQTEYIQFFSRCLESLKTRLPREYAKPSPKSYYQIPTGLGGVHFEWGFHGRPRSSLGVELHFEKGNKEQNESLISACAQIKDQLEAEIGQPVVIQKEWGENWARMFVEKQEGKITDDLREWAVEKMRIFIQVLQPELDRIKNS